MNKIEKALEKKSDERATFENGKIYKNILEVIILLTNITYLIWLYFLGGVYKNMPLNITMFIINFSTFIGIIKTARIGTFEGSINKITYELSTFHIINIYGVIENIIRLIFPGNKLIAGYMFLIGLPAAAIIILIESIYLNKKIKQA